MHSSSWDKSIFMLPVCCLEQLFAVTVVSASFPDFCNCFWRWRDRRPHKLFATKSHLVSMETKAHGRKAHFLRLWSHKQDSFTTHSRMQTIMQLHLKKLDLAFVLLSGLHPIDASKCGSKLALNTHEYFYNYSTYCWMAPNSKNDLVETINDHKLTVVSVHSLPHMDVFLQPFIQQESDEELGGKTSRFTQGSPHFGCKLNVSESWVGGYPEYQHAVT